jgi:hypothetical protein
MELIAFKRDLKDLKKTKKNLKEFLSNPNEVKSPDKLSAAFRK